MRLLCALGLLLALLHVTSCLLIGAFNIENFGHRKFKKEVTTTKGIIKAIDIIKEIVLRYDIILIQEVLDSDGKVTKRLMDLVNKGSPQFRNISSEPLGPRNRKERYLFIYRKEKVKEVKSFQYDEGKAGDFDRPPFVVKFSSTETDVKEFVLIPIHTKPDNAVKELNALVDVVAAAELELETKNIMVLGDFNGGSRYVKDKKRNKKSDWEDICLFTNKKDFHWLIKDDVATTLAEKPIQAHDRIVVTTEMEKGVVEHSAKVFDFREKYDLKDKARAVSNHFPVEVRLELKLLENPKKRERESDDLSET